MNKLSGMLLAVLLLVVANAWGACISMGSQTFTSCRYNGKNIWCDPNSNCTNACNDYCHFTCLEPYIPYNTTGKYYIGTECEYTNASGIDVCGNFPGTGTCGRTDSWIRGSQCNGYKCDTKCEADSLACFQNGGTWTNTGASTCDGKSCKFSNCLQSDTLWLNDSKAACDAIGGENNYAITDIDETCVHSGICCPPDSALVGNTCKWRCDSLYTACNAKNGYLYAGVLQDTTISGSDSTFTNKCYYNCSYAYNKDSTTSVTDGNTACASPATPIADCTRMPNDFSSVRTTYGDSVYSYDFLTPGSAAYIDSIVLTPCSRFMYRCTVNGKYKYWYSDADIPTGCTNIVKIK